MTTFNRLLVAVLLALPAAVHAQVVQGRLVGRETQAPVAGGTVRLMSADSQAVAVARTDSAGHFTLQAPAPGSYWLLGGRRGTKTRKRTPSPSPGRGRG